MAAHPSINLIKGNSEASANCGKARNPMLAWSGAVGGA